MRSFRPPIANGFILAGRGLDHHKRILLVELQVDVVLAMANCVEMESTRRDYVIVYRRPQVLSLTYLKFYFISGSFHNFLH